jgi:quercetin dioxygenase-like cupin family protein
MAIATTDTFWFIDNLVRVHVRSDETEGRGTLLEAEAPRGHMPPLHVHPVDDEIFYVLDGEFTFYVGSERHEGRPGTALLAPRGVPHTFRVESETARWLVFGTPGGFDRFVAAIGDPAEEPVLPNPPRPFDPARAAAIDYEVEILGPPGTLP